MAKINNYYEKKRLMEKLADELNKLEEDQGLKQELQFEADLKALLEKNGFSAQHAATVLFAIDPTLNPASPSLASKKSTRPIKTYKNPHTGEQVKTRGGNQKTLNAWRTEYGREVVATWES